MTQRFPHDFWASQNVEVQPGLRFDGSLPQGFTQAGPYGFSRGLDWDAIAPLNPQEELMRHFIDETVLDELDFDEEPLDEGPHACVVEDLHPAAAPTGLFVPEKYELNYPYPVILWFHDAGGDESGVLSILPRISERNYFGLSLRGPSSAGSPQQTGFDWLHDAASLANLEKQIYQTVCELRRNFHIHSERVFLAGSGSGATTALHLLLNRPEWFAGAFALGGKLPPLDPQSSAHPELSERRVFQTVPPAEDQPHARLWRVAGLNLITQEEANPTQATAARLTHLNHWLMETICTPV